MGDIRADLHIFAIQELIESFLGKRAMHFRMSNTCTPGKCLYTDVQLV